MEWTDADDKALRRWTQDEDDYNYSDEMTILDEHCSLLA